MINTIFQQNFLSILCSLKSGSKPNNKSQMVVEAHGDGAGKIIQQGRMGHLHKRC